MNYREEILAELTRLYNAKGPQNYFYADTLKCFEAGKEGFLVALNQLIHEKRILTISSQDGRVAVALNPQHLEVPQATPHIHKLIVLVVLLGFGVGGFYVLSFQKAVLLLLLVTVAIPPLLAILFENGRLTGPDIVQLYRLGLQGIPLIGKLVGIRVESVR
ncbi:MAG: hypothetical protein K2X35_16625 [Bryobacteraceae bacterium]|nr:hypothetical protein [Bryobacteraceae bacterium]